MYMNEQDSLYLATVAHNFKKCLSQTCYSNSVVLRKGYIKYTISQRNHLGLVIFLLEYRKMPLTNNSYLHCTCSVRVYCFVGCFF